MLALQPQFKRKDIRSYVIRSGRITEAQKTALADQWPFYGLDLYAGHAALTGAFIHSQAELVLEIGFGMGDSLLYMAEHFPEKNFVGIEVHPPGVGRLVNEASKRELNNLRVFCADAVDVLTDCISDGSLSRVQLYFPDPWHKTRHRKRRIVQPPFVDIIVQKLRIGGVFHLATDWQAYAEHMQSCVSLHAQLRNCAGVGGYSDRPDYRPQTKFEARGQRLGHGVWDLLFEKKATHLA